MSQFRKLISLRGTYPSTTASTQDLFLRAADFARRKDHPLWIDVNGVSKAYVAFEQALEDALINAACETNETSPERLRKFFGDFVSKFALACPRGEEFLPDIARVLFKDSELKNSLAATAILKVRGRDCQFQEDFHSAGRQVYGGYDPQFGQ